MSEMLHVSSSPHIRSRTETPNLMAMVIVALLPATLSGIWNFGVRALCLILISIAACVATEGIYERLMHKESTLKDLSAVVTGLLLGLNLPPAAPWWIPVIGGFFAILVVKQLFGGLGQNFMNPALAARCFLLLAFTGPMTDFTPTSGFGTLADTVSGATPLAALRAGESVDLLSMFLGNTAGTIGETSALALLLGGIFLVLMDSSDLSGKFPGVHASFWRSWSGWELPSGAAFRRRPDAGRLVYGHGLCDQPHHPHRKGGVRRDSGNYDRHLPGIRLFRGRGLLRNYFQQPADSAD